MSLILEGVASCNKVWNEIRDINKSHALKKGGLTLPNDKTLDMIKLRAFADDKLNVGKMTISLFDRAENTVRKGENASYQHSLPFQQCFPKQFSLESLKVEIVL